MPCLRHDSASIEDEMTWSQLFVGLLPTLIAVVCELYIGANTPIWARVLLVVWVWTTLAYIVINFVLRRGKRDILPKSLAS
ncbi:unnamed protein product (mitochondrion) [Plasmodiophora brassicae]|uniref:Uncharacterized protein n=1 Tax=Plasmodiophora brassicae TaxID=37360 RepID=A0A3P3Y9H8_PLABS|nr:unnamed protein product [Plasmodiophora brassicae]